MIPYNYEIHTSKNDTYSMDRPHFHEDVEITLCVGGEGLFFLEPEIYPLHRGQLFLFDSFILHRSVANEAYRSKVFHISPHLLQNLSSSQSDLSGCTQHSKILATLSEEQTIEMETLYQILEKNYENKFGEDFRQMIALLQFLLTAFSHFKMAESVAPIVNSDLEKMTPILNYIQEHLTEPLTIDVIASQFFISKYHLCHIFKPSTGFSVMNYVINCRILKARSLLRNGCRVQETGEQVGFRNNEHFIRTFKKLTGTSPKRYANNYKEIDQHKKNATDEFYD